LRAWDGRAVRDSNGAAMFEAPRLHLVDRVYADELGEQLLGRVRGDAAVALALILHDPNSPWFDDMTTPEVERRDEIMLVALEDAVEELTETLGRNMANWSWGDLHTATFENQTLGQSGIGPIEAIFNRGPVAVDGTGSTVNSTGYSMGDPYQVSSVPSYRQIVDLADVGRSVSMHTTGQSGHPFHPHYKDMIDHWRNFEYHPMLWNRQLVEAVAETHMTLTPGE